MRHEKHAEQIDIFSLAEGRETEYEAREEAYKREKRLQNTLIHIKKKHGKNAIVKAVSFEEGATAIARNEQIGGHKA